MKQNKAQSDSYSSKNDKDKKAKPVGKRYTDKLAKKLGKSPYSTPTKKDVEKYLGDGVYDEKRKDKSDKKPSKKFKSGGGVSTKGKKLLKAHKPSEKDKETKAKPTGYRWKTTHLKKKDGTESALAKKLHFKRPTVSEIEKYKKDADGNYSDDKKQIYHERRADRTHSDDNLKKKYNEGGDVVVVEMSVDEMKEILGREPKYPCDFVNGKKYTKCFLRPFYKCVD